MESFLGRSPVIEHFIKIKYFSFNNYLSHFARTSKFYQFNDHSDKRQTIFKPPQKLLSACVTVFAWNTNNRKKHVSLLGSFLYTCLPFSYFFLFGKEKPHFVILIVFFCWNLVLGDCHYLPRQLEKKKYFSV